MLRVEARKPCTSRVAERPKNTPLGLTRNTWPLPVRLPRMLEAEPPVTRLRTTAELEGWRNWTYWPLPMLNCCQLMMALWLVCLTTRPLAPGLVMVACPAVTLPPLGLAKASIGAMAPRPTPRWAPRFRYEASARF